MASSGRPWYFHVHARLFMLFSVCGCSCQWTTLPRGWRARGTHRPRLALASPLLVSLPNQIIWRFFLDLRPYLISTKPLKRSYDSIYLSESQFCSGKIVRFAPEKTRSHSGICVYGRYFSTAPRAGQNPPEFLPIRAHTDFLNTIISTQQYICKFIYNYQPVIWPSDAITSSNLCGIVLTWPLIYSWLTKSHPSMINFFVSSSFQSGNLRTQSFEVCRQFSMIDRSGDPEILK